MFDDIFLFVEIAEYKSFKIVAEHNNTYSSTIIRRIKNLEREFSRKLYTINHKNQIEISEDGNKLYEIFAPLKILAHDAKNTFVSDRVIKGDITLIIPPILQEILLVERLLNLRINHPELTINIKHFFYTEAGDAVRFDLAVSTTVPNVPSFIQQSILQIQVGFFATSEYIERHTEFMSLENIAKNEFIVYDIPNHQLIKNVVLSNARGEQHAFLIENFSFTCNSLRAAALLAEKSLGVVALPITYQSSSLKRIFPEFLIDFNLTVFLIQSNKSQSAKKTLVLETIKAILSEEWCCSLP